jgi:hypothetical protein
VLLAKSSDTLERGQDPIDPSQRGFEWAYSPRGSWKSARLHERPNGVFCSQVIALVSIQTKA